MDFGSLLNTAASLIQNDSNEASSSLDLGDISTALGSVMSEGGLVESVKEALSNDNLSEIVGSWVGDGDNSPISKESLIEFLGEGKIAEFASKLGVDEDSAILSLSESIPNIIDSMTSDDKSLTDNILEHVGGVDGAMSMIGKFFK